MDYLTNLPKEIIIRIVGWLLKIPYDNGCCYYCSSLISVIHFAMTSKKVSYLFDYCYMIKIDCEYGDTIATYSLKYEKNNGCIQLQKNGPYVFVNNFGQNFQESNHYKKLFGSTLEYLKKYSILISSYCYYKKGYKVENYLEEEIYSNRTVLFINGNFVGYNSRDKYNKMMAKLNKQFFDIKDRNLYNYLIKGNVINAIIMKPKMYIKL